MAMLVVLENLTPAERVARGKAARAEVPRDSHAAFDPPPDRRLGNADCV